MRSVRLGRKRAQRGDGGFVRCRLRTILVGGSAALTKPACQTQRSRAVQLCPVAEADPRPVRPSSSSCPVCSGPRARSACGGGSRARPGCSSSCSCTRISRPGPGGPQRPASPGTDAGRYVTHVRGLAVSSAITAKLGRSRTKVLCRMPCGAVYWRGARCRGEAPGRRFRCRLFEAGEPAAHRCADYLLLPPCGPSQRRV